MTNSSDDIGSVTRVTRHSGVKSDVVIAAENVYKKFCGDFRRSLLYAISDTARDLFGLRPNSDEHRPGEFWALQRISFQVRRGESVGVMGANGAGKSTLLKLLLGTLRLTHGQTMARGRVAVLTEHGIGFDPMMTGRENAYLGAAVLGIDRHRVDDSFDEIVAFAELEEFIDSPVRFYSTGMRARLGFAVAMYLEPDVLLVDEVLAVGDIGFQRRCIEHARRYIESGGSLLLVSHNPLLVQTICDRCLVLNHGKLVFDGEVIGGVARYCELVQTPERDNDELDRILFDPSGINLPDQTYPANTDPDPHRVDDPDKSGVVIDDFGIRPSASRQLKTSGPAEIFLRFRSSHDQVVRWGFCLLTADLATTITCDGRLTPFELRAGSGELIGMLPKLPLSGGQYALRVAIMDPTTDLPFATRGYRDAPHIFTVEMPITERNNYRMFARDLIILDGLAWTENLDDPNHAGDSTSVSKVGVQCPED